MLGMIDDTQVARNLQYFRRQRGLTRSRACKLARVSYSYLKKAEQCILVPGLMFEHCKRLAAVYGVSPYDFFMYE